MQLYFTKKMQENQKIGRRPESPLSGAKKLTMFFLQGENVMKVILKMMLCGIIAACLLSPIAGMAAPTSYDLVGKVWADQFSSFVWGNMTLGDVQLSTHSYPIESFSIYSSSFVFTGSQGSIDPTGWTSWDLHGAIASVGQTSSENNWTGELSSALPLNLPWLFSDPNNKPERLDLVNLSGTPLPWSDTDTHGYLYATIAGDAASVPEASTLLYALSGIIFSIPVIRRRVWI